MVYWHRGSTLGHGSCDDELVALARFWIVKCKEAYMSVASIDKCDTQLVRRLHNVGRGWGEGLIYLLVLRQVN